MKVIEELTKPDMKITIFSWNGKYLLKFERAMLEQTYKIREMDVQGDNDIKALINNEEFIQSVRNKFQEMNKSLNQVLNTL